MDHGAQPLSLYNYTGKIKITRTRRHGNSAGDPPGGIFTLLHPLATQPLELVPELPMLLKVIHRLPQWPARQQNEAKTSAWEGVESVTVCVFNRQNPGNMASGDWKSQLIERLKRVQPFLELSSTFDKRLLQRERQITERGVRFQVSLIDQDSLEEGLHEFHAPGKEREPQVSHIVLPPADPHFHLTAFSAEGKGTFYHSGIIRHMQYQAGEGWRKNQDNPGKLTLLTDNYAYHLEEQYQLFSN